MPNIVLIVIDALRAGNLGCYSAKNEISPGINKVAEEGVLFEDAYCTWNTTDPSLTTILTGKYPVSHGITNHGDKITKKETDTFCFTETRNLAEILKEHGYTTIAIDWMGRWFKRGFDFYGYKTGTNLFKKLKQYLKYAVNHLDIFRCYTDKRKFRIPSFKDIKGVLNTFLFTRELAEIQDAAVVTDAAIDKLMETAENKFFLFLHYWDVHTPYNCPKQFRKYHGPDNKKVLIDKYNGAVQYVDQQLCRLFKELKDRRIWDDTVIIITSDHGDSLTEHGIYFDHHGLYDETIRVPLIIRYPDVFPKPKRTKGFVQHVDLLPTLLNILEIDCDKFNFDGKILMPLIENRVSEIRPFIYAEESYVQKKRCIRTEKYKYIFATDGKGYCRYCHRIHKGTEELYDLEKDTHENKNIIKNNAAIKKRLKSQIDTFVDNLILNRNKLIETKDIKEEKSDNSYKNEEKNIKNRLRALGYID